MMRRALLIALLLAAPAAAEYSVPARIAVDTERVTLADLVDGAPASWADVALGNAPRPDSERRLNREWLLQRARQVGAADQLDLAGDVVLYRPGQNVVREELLGAVETALRDRLGAEEDLLIHSVGLPTAVPMGTLALDVQVPAGRMPSPTTLWVDVVVDGQREGRAWARVEIFRSRPLVVLTRDVRSGEVLAAEDVEIRSAPTNQHGITELDGAVGKRLQRTLREGSPLNARDLKAVPVVERGAPVRLVARVGGVLASTTGRCLDAGGIGDIVRVENSQSGRTVTGILRDGAVVDVNPGLGR